MCIQIVLQRWSGNVGKPLYCCMSDRCKRLGSQRWANINMCSRWNLQLESDIILFILLALERRNDIKYCSEKQQHRTNVGPTLIYANRSVALATAKINIEWCFHIFGSASEGEGRLTQPKCPFYVYRCKSPPQFRCQTRIKRNWRPQTLK